MNRKACLVAAAASLAAVLAACEQQTAPAAPAAAAPVKRAAAPEPVRPSFDCAKATTRQERLICGSPALARADRTMADSYQAQLEKMPADHRDRLLDGQRSFLTYARMACGEDATCLEWAYTQRTVDLDASFARSPAVLTLTRYATSAAPEDPLMHRTGRRLLLDQLADPATPGERLLNERMAQWLAEADAAQPVEPSWDGGIEGAAVEIRSITKSKIVVSVQGPTMQRLIDWSPELGRPLTDKDQPAAEEAAPTDG